MRTLIRMNALRARMCKLTGACFTAQLCTRVGVQVRMDDLITVAIRQNPHIERRLLDDAATRVFK